MRGELFVNMHIRGYEYRWDGRMPEHAYAWTRVCVDTCMRGHVYAWDTCMRGHVYAWTRVCVGHVYAWTRVCVDTCMRGHVYAWTRVCVKRCNLTYILYKNIKKITFQVTDINKITIFVNLEIF